MLLFFKLYNIFIIYNVNFIYNKIFLLFLFILKEQILADVITPFGELNTPKLLKQ